VSDFAPIPHLTPAIALYLWRQAAREEIGLRIPIALKDLEVIKPIFYNARKAAPDREALSGLMLCVAPGGEEIMIVKRSVEAP